MNKENLLKESQRPLAVYLHSITSIDEASILCIRYIINVIETVIKKKELTTEMEKSSQKTKQKTKTTNELSYEELVEEVSMYDQVDDMIEYLMNYMRGILEDVLIIKEQRIETFYKSYKKDKDKNDIKIRKKFKNETTLKSLIGPVKYNRMKYEFTYSDGRKENFYLLDEVIGRVSGSQFTKEYIIRLVNQVVNQSYGKSSDQMRFFGSDISRQGAWNIVIDLIGPKLFEYEKKQTLAYLKGDNAVAADRQKVSTLFIEMDGVHIAINDPKSKKRKGKPHSRREMKLGKAYIGWARRYQSENTSFRTEGTVYACGFEDTQTFRMLFEGKINEIYDLYHVKQIVVNGDGAQWIFNTFSGDNRAILQLDLYHVHAKITSCIKDKKKAKQYRKWIKANWFNDILMDIEAEKNKCTSFDTIKKLNELRTYLDNNFFYLKRHKDVDIVRVDDEDLTVRTLGTMEGSIRNVLAYRLKINGVWSFGGAKVMGMLLCYYHENRLNDILEEILSPNYEGESYMGELSQIINRYIRAGDVVSRADISMALKTINKGSYEYPVRSELSTNIRKEIISTPTISMYLRKYDQY